MSFTFGMINIAIQEGLCFVLDMYPSLPSSHLSSCPTLELTETYSLLPVGSTKRNWKLAGGTGTRKELAGGPSNSLCSHSLNLWKVLRGRCRCCFIMLSFLGKEGKVDGKSSSRAYGLQPSLTGKQKEPSLNSLSELSIACERKHQNVYYIPITCSLWPLDQP